ncbi:heterokaryon incompatibility protein-domain-containing protein [Xylariaceae sp. FL1272]|nr:heterokaryon incompatibility protein-domain-containing protein [Xylariaceae sp. FL1272]
MSACSQPPMHRNVYQYTELSDSLSQIRLLSLISSEMECGIKYSLSIFSVLNAPKFAALSYTWGDAEPNDSEHEMVNNKEAAESEDGDDKAHLTETDGVEQSRHSIVIDDTVVEIGRNLHDALFQLQRLAREESVDGQEMELFLWVDAICINQKDQTETSSQVSIMNQIYSGASRVLVWLGKDTRSEMPVVSKTLDKMSRMVEDLEPPGVLTSIEEICTSTEKLTGDLEETLDQYGLPKLSESAWKKVRSFFQRAWFQRLWVIQEAALARHITVLCGEEVIPWSSICNCARLMVLTLEEAIIAYESKKFNYVFSIRAHYIVALQKWYRQRQVPQYIQPEYQALTGQLERDHVVAPAVVFVTGVDSLATDDRDHVYGMLAISQGLSVTNSTFVPVDYSLSPCEVYTAATRKIIETTFHLGIFLWINNKDFERVDLPSWAFDFQPQPLEYRIHRVSFNASGVDRYKYARQSGQAITFHDNVLKIHARKVGVISNQSELLNDIISAATNAELLSTILLKEDNFYTPTSQSRTLVFLQMFVGMLDDEISDLHGSNRYDDLEDIALHSQRFWLAQLAIRYHSLLDSGEIILSALAPLDFMRSNPAFVELCAIDESYTLPTMTEIIYFLTERSDEVTITTDNIRSVFVSGPENVLIRRKVFETENGYMGMAFDSFSERDEIWITPTSNVPLILRPVGVRGGKKRFRLVTYSYVHGIMQGELFKARWPTWEAIEIV